MSLNSFSSRPPTKSSFTSQSQHSNSNQTRNKKQTPARTVSNLKRSNELLSVEYELRELLKHSRLNQRQKKAFSEMLETTFDLFQAPLQSGSHQESLIDSSSIELYSKMQSLVTALTSLIMNEEEATRHDITHIEEEQGTEQDDDSTEFSDGEDGYKPVLEPIQSNVFPRSSTISNFRPLTRSSSIAETTRRPSIRSNNSPTYRPNISPTLYNPPLDIRPNNRYQELQPNRSPFQPMQAPIPRSFSTRSERPKSMYVGNQELPNLPSMSSTRSINNLHGYVSPHDQFHQEFGSDHGGFDDSRYSTRSGSIRDSATRSKRYSMRF